MESQDLIPEVSLPSELPILAVTDLVVFPHMMVPLVVREDDAELVNAVVAGDRFLGCVTRQPAGEESTGEGPMYQIGSVAHLHKMLQMPDETRRILIRGVARIRIDESIQTTPYRVARVTVLEDIATDESDEQVQALRQSLLDTFEQIVALSGLPEEAFVQALNVPEISVLSDLVGSALEVDLAVRQEMLETADVRRRLTLVHKAAHEQLVRLQAARRLSADIQEEVGKAQRDFYLREQLKAIRRELGEEGEDEEIAELRQRLAETQLTEAAREVAERELDRLARMNPAAPEHSVVRTYLEWILELPWFVSSEEHIDVDRAQDVLDRDHYDLKDVKDRIVEYLAVRQIKPDLKGPILCFVGPPGVGKTSLGRSIARATGREFIRMSLGGVRDEAEIRGHRRTYVGALPGRIIQGLRTVGTNNPVFMLDEVDKIGADFRGDPSSALLEVLDPAQNDTFSDHYLEIPFDLSRVMFITTGNITATVPPALLDRMEVLHLPGYTDEEKMHIATRYLIPRQRSEHGLTAKQVRISDGALRRIISNYTREAGVRNLERTVATICRKVARGVAGGETGTVSVKVGDLEDFLGHQQFFHSAAERITVPGVATGLAWTEAGGEILFVEASRMPGKKSLTLTGQLGEVMQESAQAALSWVRSNAEALGIEPNFYEKSDIHIHVPSGATPKDGPSAGVAMAAALSSLLTGRLAKSNVAMTGEITLRGKVLPVGGIKEKVLAARRAGLDTVILPAQNEGAVLDMEEDLRGGINFVFVDSVDEVIAAALEPANT